jgi:predicted CopG family antitoxin
MSDQNRDEKEGKSGSELIKGLTPVKPEDLAEFEQAMTDEVIPEIVKVVEKRRLRAAKSRQRQLKC